MNNILKLQQIMNKKSMWIEFTVILFCLLVIGTLLIYVQAEVLICCFYLLVNLFFLFRASIQNPLALISYRYAFLFGNFFFVGISMLSSLFNTQIETQLKYFVTVNDFQGVSSYIISGIFALLSLIIFNIGYESIKNISMPKICFKGWKKINFGILQIFFLMLIEFGLLFYINSSKVDTGNVMYSISGPTIYLFCILRFLQFFIPLCIFYFFFLTKNKIQKIEFMCLALIQSLNFIFAGSRSVLFVIFVAFFLWLIYFNKETIELYIKNKTLVFKQILTLLLLMPMILCVLSFSHYYREYVSITNNMKGKQIEKVFTPDLIIDKIKTQPFAAMNIDSFEALQASIIAFKDNKLYGSSILQVFFNFVPRKLWNDKPEGFGNTIAKKVWGVEKLNDLIICYGPTVWAEFYANFGFIISLIISFFLGMFFKVMDMNFFKTKNTLFIFAYLINYYYIIFMTRGDLLSSIFPCFINIFLITILFSILNHKIRLKF